MTDDPMIDMDRYDRLLEAARAATDADLAAAAGIATLLQDVWLAADPDGPFAQIFAATTNAAAVALAERAERGEPPDA